MPTLCHYLFAGRSITFCWALSVALSCRLTGGALPSCESAVVQQSPKVTDDAAPGAVIQRPHPDALPNIHAPGEVDNQELVTFIVPHSRRLDGIVVDETDAILKGSWQYSTHTPPYVGIGYLHDRNSGKGTSSVTYQPQLPAAGIYEVRISHCYNQRRSTNTPITIQHADGQTTIRINQQQIPEHARLFRTLGRFRFAAGNKGWVRISNEGTEGKYVIADAVQFLPVAP
jgi:hypothetical protein